MWTAFYDDFPGPGGAAGSGPTALCGAEAVVSLPTAASWADGHAAHLVLSQVSVMSVMSD